MTINTETQLCGVIGRPVHHSLSPAIHNAAFRHLALNYVYLAFPVEDAAGAIRGLRALGNVRGCSVTIPHKVAAMAHLDTIDPAARHIGAVNTIVKAESALTGCNTDAAGALRALEQAGVALDGRQAVILGSGGAARAVAFGLALQASAAAITILAIDDAERRRLAGDVRAAAAAVIDDRPLNTDTLRDALVRAHLVIHCTPVGMVPEPGRTCVPAHLLHPALTVMDIVYTPPDTRLLQDARAAGCRVISGVEMFLHQAAAQFELWTGHPAPLDVMRRVVESARP